MQFELYGQPMLVNDERAVTGPQLKLPTKQSFDAKAHAVPVKAVTNVR